MMRIRAQKRKHEVNHRVMKIFSNTARFFHWTIAALIISQYVLAKMAEMARDDDQILQQLALLANHKSIGISILVMAVFRLSYRFLNPSVTNETAVDMPHWQVKASSVSHLLLYVFLFALPISGWLMSSAKAYSVSWFNLIILPDFIRPNEGLAELLKDVHYFLAIALFVVTLVHVAAALKHHFIDKDQVLSGMAGRKSWALFILCLVVSVLFFGRFIGENRSQENQTSETRSSVQNINESVNSNLPIWDIDYQQSYIKFTGDQAGAPFTGEWQKWQADIQFEANNLADSRFNVSIDTASGFSNDKERDETIRSADFFNVNDFAYATYKASKFVQINNAYKSDGQLLMKGFVSPAALNFTVTEEGDSVVLTGSTVLDRLVWNIGAGDWTDTSWVGQEVKVSVRVVAKR